MSKLTDYFKDLRDIYNTGSGVKETSYYPAFEAMANAYGKELKPRVRCVINLQNKGAGIPDAGFFTSSQFQRGEDKPRDSQLPERGCAEIKSTKDDVLKIAENEQVAKYLNHYGAVLVTNYRDFLLIGKDAGGKAEHLERFSFADTEGEFWREVRADASAFAARFEKSFDEFIKRVFLHAVPLTKPEDVAWFLASYAREAKERVEAAKNLDALQSLRKALEEAVGFTFKGEEGEHFFRSTLIQTLFYGVFSAWVLWSKKNSRFKIQDSKSDGFQSEILNPESGIPPFDWRTAVWELKVPMIRALYSQVATPQHLEPLGLVELLDRTNKVLNRIRKPEFFQKFSESHAVQYFYEPFLENFDAELRKQLGVWYTPEEIVRYMVARVDTVLKEELNLPDGLADENVYILDPCCGTGAYLVEVLKHIAQTLKERGDNATIGATLREAVTKRIFGFEILPAPFVVAHLQIGLFLQSLGTELKDERAAIYLTNALTGWEKPKDEQIIIPIPEMQQERDQAQQVKQSQPILVILGNPPYNAFAGTSPEEEQGLVEPYKDGLIKKWGIKKFNLDDLYIRFFRLAERRIAEKTGKGVVCFISNFSYTFKDSYVVMREKLINSFDKFWFDSFNGDSRETGKQTPEGKPDPSIFSTEYNKEGIRVGTTVGLMVRNEERETEKQILYRDFWGTNKRADALATLNDDGTLNTSNTYQKVNPTKQNKYSFRPSNIGADYESWLKLDELCFIPPFNGTIERRGNSLIAFNLETKEFEKVRDYFDLSKTDEDIAAIEPRFMKSSGEFVADNARKNILENAKRENIGFNEKDIVAYPFKPFDIRAVYLSEHIQPLFSRPSPKLLKHRFKDNFFLISRDSAHTIPEGSPFYASKLVCDYDSISGHARHFPIFYLPALFEKKKAKKDKRQISLLDDLTKDEPKKETKANLSAKVRAYLENLGLNDADENAETASLVWYHALAVGYSPLYLSENADGIRQDFPRVPLPAKAELLQSSAALGKRIAALLDTETGVSGVTAGRLDAPFASIGALAHAEGKNLDGDDFKVEAGWGHAGKGGVTMPAKGKHVERDYTEAETNALTLAAEQSGLSPEDIKQTLGATTFDIYLNDSAYWRNIPRNVWEYTIGGYQVIKKWLSYREAELLGRALTLAEANEVRDIARRISAILLSTRELNENYLAAKTSNAATNDD
jgi:hypothetical protein